jgi:phage-related protein
MIVEFFTKTIPDAWKKFKDDWATGMDIIVEWVTVKVPQFFSDCWQSIKDTFSNVGTWFEDTFNNAWENVKNAFASWGEFFSGLWDNIKNTFSALGTTLGDAIGGAVKSGINGVIQNIERTINSGIDTINGAINVINNIPGVSIGYMNGLSLPRLAKGGIVDSPTIAQIGEDGQEAVVPLQNNLGWLKALARKLADELNSGVAFNNSTSSNVTNNFYQTNNSPKSLSRLEIYRQSKNLLSFKGG